jgi:hypothetical protein
MLPANLLTALQAGRRGLHADLAQQPGQRLVAATPIGVEVAGGLAAPAQHTPSMAVDVHPGLHTRIVGLKPVE